MIWYRQQNIDLWTTADNITLADVAMETPLYIGTNVADSYSFLIYINQHPLFYFLINLVLHIKKKQWKGATRLEHHGQINGTTRIPNPDPYTDANNRSKSDSNKKNRAVEKTKAAAGNGLKKVKAGTSLGFNWIKDLFRIMQL